MSSVITDMISSPSASGSAGKGSRLPDLGSDYKPPMSGKALPVAFLAYYGCDAVLLEILKCLLYSCVVDCSVLPVLLFNSVSFTHSLANIC